MPITHKFRKFSILTFALCIVHGNLYGLFPHTTFFSHDRIMLTARPPLSDSLSGTNWNICVNPANSYFWNKEKDPSLIWVHKIPGLKVRPHCGSELFNDNEPNLSHILITDEYRSYMKYRRNGRGSPMRLGKSYCHNHLATDNSNASALICDHVALLWNQVLYGLPWTRSVPDMSD